MFAVHAQRADCRPGHNVVREGEAQTHPRGKLGGKIARAEQPDFRHGDVVRHGANALERMIRRKAVIEKREQVLQPCGKIVGAEQFARTAQRQRGERVSAGRAAEAEIDAAGMQRLENAKRFGDLQWRVIRQHHAAGADANVFRARSRRGRS